MKDERGAIDVIRDLTEERDRYREALLKIQDHCQTWWILALNCDGGGDDGSDSAWYANEVMGVIGPLELTRKT